MSHVSVHLDGESLITSELVRKHERRDPRSGHPVEHDAWQHLFQLFETVQDDLEHAERMGAGIDCLFNALQDVRAQLDRAKWNALVASIQKHPIIQTLHEDPFTRRSFEKPRGYSGDAPLLDLIYGHPSEAHALAAASSRGRAINVRTAGAPAAVAVRQRRQILAQEVDRTAAAAASPTEVLSIAAGHLREAALSSALSARTLKRWVALDQDPESVATMRNDFAADSCIYPLEGSVRELLKGDCSLGQFNFIYAAGLYDYLLEPVAIKLTQRCLSMLRPGGTFLFANFADSIQDAGYMEACMDWALLLRSEVEVRDIASAAVGARGFDVRVQRQGNGNIIYAWIERRKLRRSARGTGRCAPTGSLF